MDELTRESLDKLIEKVRTTPYFTDKIDAILPLKYKGEIENGEDYIHLKEIYNFIYIG